VLEQRREKEDERARNIDVARRIVCWFDGRQMNILLLLLLFVIERRSRRAEKGALVTVSEPFVFACKREPMSAVRAALDTR
jgi:hypothetical protein